MYAKNVILAGLTIISGYSFAAEPCAQATIVIDQTQKLGAIKPMHAVNNGPSVKKPGGDQMVGNFDDYCNARFPFARTHDSINCVSGGAHCCDISAVFPDFAADESNPTNYDFVFTDHYLDNIHRAGTEIFFRLGQTIEHGPKKYGVLPPKDYAKWARICEHVIRHYNEGWGWNVDTEYTTRNVAWSNQFNIVYWEIWNEPDLDPVDIGLPKNPRCWGGTVTNFFELFEITAKHLKKTFPKLKIGGPAICGREDWGDRFLDYCEKKSVPLDFFSWHVYARNSDTIAEKAARIRRMMDKHGYDKAESILNEWNYIKGWVDDFVYSLRVESGDLNLKGASFIASTMIDCQYQPVDMLMFYDARLSTSMNNLFARTTYWPLKGYYPFYAWSRLVDYGTQVKCTVSETSGIANNANTGNVERKDKTRKGAFHAVATVNADGSAGALLVSRYSDDDNVSDIGTVKVVLPGRNLANAKCHITDMVRTYTEIPVTANGDGAILLRMQPLSFALIEY